MQYKHKKTFTLILILLITQVGLIYILFSKENKAYLNSIEPKKITKQNKEELISVTHSSYYQKKSFYDKAYDSADVAIIPNQQIYGGIIPHHLLPKDKIATWFQGLEHINYKTIVLIGPNHFDQGNSQIILSQANWDTPYGKLLNNIDLSDKLKQNKIVEVDENPFYIEHSISGLVPFIKRSFPEAKIVPIILKIDTPKERLDVLVNQLTSTLDTESTLVISSVDFSHYQSGQVADFHDRLSRGVVEDFDTDRLFDLEIDSPESLYVLLSYLKNIDKQKAQLVFHTNSSYLINKAEEPGTSHFGFYFMAGEPTEQKIVNQLFFGDLMLDRYIKTALEKKGLSYILEDIAGGENRFFMGNDIVSANLEGAITFNAEHYAPELTNDFALDSKYIKQLKDNYFFDYFNLANNHISDQGNQGLIETSQNLKNLNINFAGCSDSIIADCSTTNIKLGDINIGMAGFSMVYHKFDIDDATNKIKDLKNKNDLVITQIHWGEEYQHEFNDTQQEVAHKLIEAGSDIIIGHHPHVVQGMEIYQNKPIFYSLGNFIFDQYFSDDTQKHLSLGLSYNLEKKEYTVYLFPFKSNANKLSFMKGAEKESFFTSFIAWSQIEEKYKETIKTGIFQIK